MKKVTGWDYMSLALLAFAGIGLEVPLFYWIEPFVYGVQYSEWSVVQHLIHWTVTCILWGTVAYLLIRCAKNKYGFDICERGSKVKAWQWLTIAVVVVLSLVISYIDWNGSKVIKEFYANGWLKFIFQYIYYVFEVVLVTLILVFGQRAFEIWFHKPNIPYGGILIALTWGIGHFFTKGILTGILCMISGLAFGSVYLLVNRDIRKAYGLLFVIFVL
ncbi:MAG: hypothetical protein IJ326_10180 [Lachnospiraceae bacterium]|nr:hypothetical protein [Lachnospiraceae bacterium]